MQFFNNCTTVDDVKQLYKQLAKENHPDLGGCLETMQKINVEYAFAIAKLLKGENLTDQEINDKLNLSELYRAAVEKVITLPNITIELIGNWIWATGNTYPVKDTLKEAGFYFAPKKTAWYFRSEEYKTKGGRKSLDEIRNKYGSAVLNSNSSKVQFLN